MPKRRRDSLQGIGKIPVGADAGHMTFDEVKVGVLPPVIGTIRADPKYFTHHLASLAIEAERLGFDAFWAADSALRARVEPLTLLTYVSAATERIGLGTAAMVPAYRNAVSAAQAITTLDRLSDGRLTLGVGAGYPGRSDPEFDLVGVSTRRRSQRLDDIVGLWRALWSGADGAQAYRNDHFKIAGLPETYRTSRSGGPPIWLAAGTPAALIRAGGLYDGWLPYPPSPQAYRDGLAVVRAASATAGRRPGAAALYMTVVIADDAKGARALADSYCRQAYGASLDGMEKIQVFVCGDQEQVRGRISEFVAAGAEHLVVRLPALEPHQQEDHLHRVADALVSRRPTPFQSDDRKRRHRDGCE